ncbi:MAG TPA: XRE family transcriptional regulator [Firmicutes bacterium]|nr:XRE family transcriptional regulator [Bacillota bacterium]HBK68252.1 XRE family transcriptional regulator [Bacillota bacterium]HBT17836.1 XRE family transcriptional regulator [Bacillota bacterium]
MSFGTRLRSLREEQGLYQKDLAFKLDLTQKTISNYENNERFPDQKTLSKIADLFNVSIDFLLDRTDIRNPMEIVAAHRTDDPMTDLPESAKKSVLAFIKLVKDELGIKE